MHIVMSGIGGHIVRQHDGTMGFAYLPAPRSAGSATRFSLSLAALQAFQTRGCSNSSTHSRQCLHRCSGKEIVTRPAYLSQKSLDISACMVRFGPC